ncbi:hypothetical protein [Streptomyces sp. NBC_01236]|uniref:hypothetical protein n=1 Tax=Streptomyces sp. NBC_01236 TaxID=2903789 RepID=UPI002E130A85|nr:hypothetical protein OG324_33935 [Streptomyces sp. NBC_01236]
MENQNPGVKRARLYEPERHSIRVPQYESDLMPRFKLIFSTVAVLTVLALILNVLLAAFGGRSEEVKAASDACSTTYMMGFGAIVGLIGGKVT